MRDVSVRPALAHLLFAWVSATLGVVHAVSRAGPVTSVGVRSLPPLLLSVVLVYTGYRFHQLGPSDDEILSAAILLLGGGVYGAGFVVFIEWVQMGGGSPLMEAGYAVLLAGAGGTTMATVIAHYYVAYASRVAEARAESERARQLQEQVSVLNRALRHNIRNELTVINGWLDIAFDGVASVNGEYERIQAHLEKLEAMSETARLIQEVLQTDRRIEMDVVEQVESVVTGFDERSTPATIDTEIPVSATAVAHPQLDAAIEEAIRNALEHNDPDELVIEVVVRPIERDGDDVTDWCIEVTDNGEGIPAVEREALRDTEKSPLEHGQGLGLYLIKSILDQSDGRLQFAGDRAGTTVRLILPSAAETEVDPAAEIAE